jgi:hypothetical protein
MPGAAAANLVRGQTKSLEVSFTPNETLSNLVVRVVPELEPFVQVSPSALTKIASGSTVTLTIITSAPATSTLGTFEGTVQLRQGGHLGKVAAKPLPVSVTIGETVTEAIPGVTFQMPSGWSGTFSNSNGSLISPETLAQIFLPDAADIPPDITVGVRDNPENLSLKRFVDKYNDGWYTHTNNALVCRLPRVMPCW